MKDYVKKDAELEATATKSTEALAKHRWHWTLDESNLDRVSINQYAKDVNRAWPAIAKMARGYDEWSSNSRVRTLGECIELANMGAERAAATEAVAEATGKSVSTMRAGQNRVEVTAVLDTARERAERKGTTVETAIIEVAEWREKSRRAAKRYDTERKARHSLRFVEIEGHLAGAKRKLTDALRDSDNVDFTDDEMELLRFTISNVKALLELIDLRLAGTPDINWDAELATLTKEPT